MEKRLGQFIYYGVGIVIITTSLVMGYPSTINGEERYLERELSNPGNHQLVNWLIDQIRRNGYGYQLQDGVYGLPPQGKRNSELTNSMLGLPSQMIKNGRK